MMVLWCGTNPALDYNGGFVLSRYVALERVMCDVIKIRLKGWMQREVK